MNSYFIPSVLTTNVVYMIVKMFLSKCTRRFSTSMCIRLRNGSVPRGSCSSISREVEVTR